MTDEYVSEPADDTAAQSPAASGGQYGAGPFTIREIVILGAWLVAFVVSFFSDLWLSGLGWVLTIGVPTAAVFLIVLRRFSPQGIRRVGSLGIDQFASVAFSVSAVLWLTRVWGEIAATITFGEWLGSWVTWVELVMMLVLVVATVFGPLLPPFSEDFDGRPEEPAHRNARAVRPVIARPRPVPAPQPTPQDASQQEWAGAGPGYDPSAQPYDPNAPGYDPSAQPYDPNAQPYDPNAAGHDQSAAVPSYEQNTTGDWAAPGAAASDDGWAPQPAYARSGSAAAEPVAEPTAEPAVVEPEPAVAEPEPAASEQPAPHAYQAFWALVPVERDVVDETGAALFRIGPTAWALVIEDRGETFVVRHDDGRVGFLHDVSGITRG